MYPKLALSRDVYRVSFLASKDKLTILVLAKTYISRTCVKNTISSFGTSFPNTFQRPPREDTLVSVGCLKTNPTLCSSTLIGVSIIV